MAEQVTHDAATLEALGKAKLLDGMYDNPDTKNDLLRVIKKHNPQARIPEIDAVVSTVEALKPHIEEIGKTKAELQQELANARAERVQAKAQKDLDLNDEEFKEVTKLATEKRIGDLATAAEHYRMTKMVAEPRSGPDTTILAPSMKELWENPTQFARNEARKVLHEIDIAKKRSR